jgi:hypothetical protein
MARPFPGLALQPAGAAGAQAAAASPQGSDDATPNARVRATTLQMPGSNL